MCSIYVKENKNKFDGGWLNYQMTDFLEYIIPHTIDRLLTIIKLQKQFHFFVEWKFALSAAMASQTSINLLKKKKTKLENDIDCCNKKSWAGN